MTTAMRAWAGMGVCVALLGACPGKPAQPPPPRDAGAPPPSSHVNGMAPGTDAPALERPPFPAMATSQYGFAVLQAWTAAITRARGWMRKSRSCT